jgi:hypothetical protein
MNFNRRDFLRKVALSGAGLNLLSGSKSKIFALPQRKSALGPDSLISIQMGPHSLLDEGIEPVLDFLKNEAQMNSLMIYSHTYYGAGTKPKRVLAHDHHVPPLKMENRKLPMSWVRHNDGYFKNTILRHKSTDKSYEYHDRDIFSEIRKPADDRGMKIFFRILETRAKAGIEYITNFEKVLVEDVYGNPGDGPCWNNPDYRNWIYATVEDIFRSYDVDGLQYGAERVGPLSQVWFSGQTPACFCQHCQNRNSALGIDPERAREGYRLIHEYMQKVAANTDESPDTVSVNLWRFLQKYPELLSWNYQWFQADEEIQKEVYLRSKKIKSNVIIGRHVDHQRSSWDFFYRSAVDYEQMADYADFVKPILYHDVYGPRLRWWVVEEWKKRGFKDFSREHILQTLYDMMGYSPGAQVDLKKLEVDGMGPQYVYDEVKRCVSSVKGKADVIAGLGIDVLWHAGGQQPFLSDPIRLQQAIFKSVEAGASGILASREYDEMRFSSLKAFGEAVRQLM